MGFFLLKTYSFSLHKTLTDGLQSCGLVVDYCDVFNRCLDSHSDGTHPLMKRCNAKFLQILDGLTLSTFSANIDFWVDHFIYTHS